MPERYFKQEHFDLIEKFGGALKDSENAEHDAAYQSLKSAYAVTKRWAEKLKDKCFPDGSIKVVQKPTNQANKFQEYNWARIYPPATSTKNLAYTVGISVEGFTVKIDSVFAKPALRAEFEKLRGPSNNDSPIVSRLTITEGLRLSLDELVEWSGREIHKFGLSYDQIAEKLGITKVVSEPSKVIVHNKKYDNKLAKNIIYYGPPGTGKTYKLQTILKDHYTERDTIQERRLWLSNIIEKLGWHEIIILILLDSKEPIKVPDIVTHEYYQAKAKLNERTANLGRTAWSNLQSHAIADSLTVNSSRQFQPLVFDKTDNSCWYIVDSEKEQVEEYVKLLAVLKSGPQQTDTVKRYEFVTFHQSYGYEEFIEGLRPVTNDDGEISYEVKPGVFKRICKRAESDPANRYAIVIDEINRGNISKIFGELITLVEVDKRANEKNELTVTLPYSGLPFSVPSNLDIIGTMNTADRSLTHIDVALRRRFDFRELRTDYSLITNNVDGINLRHMLYAINQRIELLLDREHILGHALLMKVNSLASLQHTFKTNILPLLEEYFFENWDKINQVLNDNGFIEEQKDAHSIWLGNVDDYAAKSYRVNTKALSNNEAYQKIYSGIDAAYFLECDKA